MIRSLAAILTAFAILAPTAQASEIKGPCPGYSLEEAAGCYDSKTDTVYYDTGETLLHERGHRLDHKVLEPRGLRPWMTRMLGWRKGTPWFGEPGEISPGEHFAEAYALCKRPMRPGTDQSQTYGYDLYNERPRQHRAICNAIAMLEFLERSAR